MEINDNVGVVLWIEGDEVTFRIYKDKRVHRGQLLKIIDQNIKFIIKVTDFKPETLLSPAEISRISFKIEKGESIDIMDEELRCYYTATGKIICQIDDYGYITGPTTIPKIFSNVKYITPKDLEEIRLETGDIKIGYLRSGHKATGSTISINGEKAFPHHILVCSITGGGKTNFGKVLAWNIMKEKGKYSMLIIDTESEYFDGGDKEHLGLVHSIHSEKGLVYITPRVKFPCKIQYEFRFGSERITRNIQAYPLEIWWGTLQPEDFEQTGEYTPPQEALLWMMWRRHRENWLKYLIERDANLIYNELRGKIQKTTILVTKRKILKTIGEEIIFKSEECKTRLINEVLKAISEGKVILIDMPTSSESQEKLVTVLFARRIFKFYERCRKIFPKKWEKLPTTLIMVEEAHRYLSKQALYQGGVKRENIFAIISKRGRKYRVGVCCITQMPGELDEPLIRQQLTKIILPLPTKPDYQLLINYSPYLDDSGTEMKTLDKGEAIIISPPSGIKFAVPAKIFKYENIIIDELANEVYIREEQVEKE